MVSPSILLIEDSALFRNALANLFALQKLGKLTCCSSERILKRPAVAGYDVVLIDAVTWTCSLPELAELVARVSASLPVILLGREDLFSSYLDALRAGAVGFVSQTASARELSRAVQSVVSGGVWFEGQLLQEILLQTPFPRDIRLNPKEKLIMDLVVRGRTNKEIGASLGLRERTIKSYMAGLFLKTGASNRSGLAAYAITHGLARST